MKSDSSRAPRALFLVTALSAAAFALSAAAAPVQADPPQAVPAVPAVPLVRPLPTPVPSGHLVLQNPVVEDQPNGGGVLKGTLVSQCPNQSWRSPLQVYDNGVLLGTFAVNDLAPGQSIPFVLPLSREPSSTQLNIGSQAGGAGAGKIAFSPFAVVHVPARPVFVGRPFPSPSPTGIKPNIFILVLPPCD